jgi:hypothetical protein
MNDFQKAKREIRLADVLAKLGRQPVQQHGDDWWYISPFRQEEEASFHICTRRNIWNDFGDTGGSVIDFAMRFFGCGPGQALWHLRRLHNAPVPAWAPVLAAAAGAAPVRSPIVLKKVKPFENRILVGYLQRRGIPYGLAQRYVQEAYYVHQGRSFFGVAFKNDEGGYELRSGGHADDPTKTGFKGAVPPKAITTLHAEQMTPGGAVAVFEGFVDFLSWLAHTGQREPPLPVIVLNSGTLKERGLAALRRLGAGTVQVYFDHDGPGRRLTAEFAAALPGVNVQDEAGVYQGYKDYNAMLEAMCQQANRR